LKAIDPLKKIVNQNSKIVLVEQSSRLGKPLIVSDVLMDLSFAELNFYSIFMKSGSL
jgi:hypothetical protein